uniref:Uncharacterized protein n=1 Tax=Anguilla anguilla TaxID=7936 RepID=A0A0E9T223_ANGAN
MNAFLASKIYMFSSNNRAY